MYKALKAAAEAGQISNELAEALSKDIYENDHKAEISALRQEAKDLRIKNEDLSSNYEQISASKAESDEKLKDIDSKIENARLEGKGELEKELNAKREKEEALQKSLDNLQKANTGLKLDRVVAETLKTFDIRDDHKDTTEFMLRSRVTVNDKGDMVYSDNGNEFSIEDGFKGYFETNQGKLNPQGNGGGSGANDGGGSGNTKVKSRDEFEKMNPSQKATFMNDGGKLTA